MSVMVLCSQGAENEFRITQAEGEFIERLYDSS